MPELFKSECSWNDYLSTMIPQTRRIGTFPRQHGKKSDIHVIIRVARWIGNEISSTHINMKFTSDLSSPSQRIKSNILLLIYQTSSCNILLHEWKRAFAMSLAHLDVIVIIVMIVVNYCICQFATRNYILYSCGVVNIIRQSDSSL